MRLLRALVLFIMLALCLARNGAADDEEDAAGATDREQAERIAAALDDRRLAAQVILSGVDGSGKLEPDMRTLFRKCPAGGIVLFRYNLDTDTAGIRNLIAESAALISRGTGNEGGAGGGADGAAAVPGIAPFVAVDHEGGSVNRFRPGVASLDAAGTYWELAQEAGADEALARIAADSFSAGTAIKDLGINLNLAPVAEYLTGDNRDFLGDRSYGPDPVFTSAAAGAFIRGMERAGLLCGIKHFPGNAGPDPHDFPSVLQGDVAALDGLVAPFAALIRGGQARAIMVSHSAVPARDAVRIASLSPQVMNGWLRGELGFAGIIISDDFSMAAAGSVNAGDGTGLSSEQAAVQSLAAGADMVLVWPADIRRTHRAIMAALSGGALPRDRLREAAARIISEKLKMGLIDG